MAFSSNTFGNCYNLYYIVLKNCTTIGHTVSVNDSRSIFLNCNNLRRLILPSVIRFQAIGQYSAEQKLSMVDIGKSLIGILGGNKRLNRDTVVVIRTETPPNDITSFFARCVYVPATALKNYKESDVWAAFEVFAIGGDEWVAEYGSADEYANLTQQEYEDNYA